MKQRPRRTHASETSYSNVVSYEAPSHSRVMMPCPRLWSVSSALAGDPLVGRRPRSKPRVGDASFQPSRLLASPTKTSWARNSPWPRSWCFSNCNSRAKHDKNRRCKINNCKPRATDQIVCLILRCAKKTLEHVEAGDLVARARGAGQRAGEARARRQRVLRKRARAMRLLHWEEARRSLAASIHLGHAGWRLARIKC